MLTRILSLCGLVLVSLWLPLAQATDRYASPGGGGPCGSTNINNPQGGMNNAIGCMQAGDRLLLLNGSYNESLDLSRVPGGSSSFPTIIKSLNIHGAVLVNGNAISATPGNQWITVDGLVVDQSGVGCGRNGLNASGNGGTTYNQLFTNIEIKNMAGDTTSGEQNYCTTAAISAGWYAQNVVFDNMYVHDIGYNQGYQSSCNECYGYGIYMSGVGFTLQNSYFKNLSGFAVHGYSSGAGATSYLTIRNNYFERTGAGVLVCQHDNQVYNNVLNNVGGNFGMGASGGGNNYFGFRFNYFCSGQPGYNDLIANNTVVGSYGTCMELGYLSNSTIVNNICYQNGSDRIDYMNSSGITAHHNLFATDPLFVNRGAADFHLQSGSPARDAGTPIAAFPTDAAGLPRPQRPSLGAVEWRGATPARLMSLLLVPPLRMVPLADASPVPGP